MTDNKYYEASIRWQAYARESRTSANSHFLTYSAAILALQSSILVDNGRLQIEWPYTYVVAGGLAILSLVLGSIVVLVRLRDARLTARVARYRYTNRSQQEIDAMRKKADFYSGWANKLLPMQVFSFAFSAIFFVAWVVGANAHKLFG